MVFQGRAHLQKLGELASPETDKLEKARPPIAHRDTAPQSCLPLSFWLMTLDAKSSQRDGYWQYMFYRIEAKFW